MFDQSFFFAFLPSGLRNFIVILIELSKIMNHEQRKLQETS
jgi:hypothetical protein